MSRPSFASALFIPAVVLACLSLGAAPAFAQRARSGGGGGAVGRAVPRAAGPAVRGPVVVGPRVVVAPYRGFGYGYYYPYFSSFSFGIYAGYPYGFGYPYAYGYPYAAPYGYPYAVGGYVGGYASAYGGVRIVGAPPDAQVYVDGYYAGIASDFDGAFQHLSLAPGAHHLELRVAGQPVNAVDIRVEPGRTITFHAEGQ